MNEIHGYIHKDDLVLPANGTFRFSASTSRKCMWNAQPYQAVEQKYALVSVLLQLRNHILTPIIGDACTLKCSPGQMIVFQLPKQKNDEPPYSLRYICW
jgi:hypothetical protein